MNQLLEQMKRLKLDESETLNVLQDAGIISDHCVRVWEIAPTDLARAVLWLRGKRVRYGDGHDINAKVLV